MTSKVSTPPSPPPTFTAAEAIDALASHPRHDAVAVADLGGGGGVVGGADLVPLRLLEPHRGGATALAWHPGGDLVATGGADGVVRIQHLGIASTALDVGGPVRAVRWSPAGDPPAVAAGSGIWIVDGEGTHVAAAPLLTGAVHDAAWIRGGPAPLAVAGRDGVAWFGPGRGSEPVETWAVTGAARVLAVDPTLGSFATRLLDRAPRASVVAADVDPEMLAVADRIASGWQGRMAVVGLDLLDVTSRALGESRFDAVVLTSATHYLDDDELLAVLPAPGRPVALGRGAAQR